MDPRECEAETSSSASADGHTSMSRFNVFSNSRLGSEEQDPDDCYCDRRWRTYISYYKKEVEPQEKESEEGS